MNNLQDFFSDMDLPIKFDFSGGLTVILSAPSGTGKSTITRELLKRNPDWVFSVSVTSRPRRASEEEGKSYFFVPRETFETYIQEDRFAEWARVHGHYYGTLKSYLRDGERAGIITLLDLDTQGALNLKKKFHKAVMIFVLPPSVRALKERLEGRMTEDENNLEIRLKNAENEVCEVPHYDYLVVNDRVDNAVSNIESIVNAEKCKRERLLS